MAMALITIIGDKSMKGNGRKIKGMAMADFNCMEALS
jgi:hypothetical protein